MSTNQEVATWRYLTVIHWLWGDDGTLFPSVDQAPRFECFQNIDAVWQMSQPWWPWVVFSLGAAATASAAFGLFTKEARATLAACGNFLPVPAP